MSDQKKSDALTLAKALAEEYAAVTGEPEPAPTPDPKNPEGEPTHKLEHIQRLHFTKGTAALCLSGGGIRSAAFGLGVMQGLAKRGLLKRFHYLSTVSGGGYAGSFASAWAYRAEGGIAEVERELAKPRPEPADGNDEYDALRRLRRYSNYLSPRAGISSLDTWTLIVTYLRNLALNWILLLPLLALAVCLPFLVHALFAAPFWTGLKALEIAGALTTVLGLFVLRWRTYSTSSVGVFRRYLRYDWIVLALLFAGAWFAAVDYHTSFGRGVPDLARADPIRFAGWTLVFGFALGVIFVAIDMNRKRHRPLLDRSVLLLAFILTAIVSGIAAAFWLECVAWIAGLSSSSGGTLGAVLARSQPGAMLAIFGPPSWLVLLLLPEVLFLGLAASLSDDHDREWWTRNVALALRGCVSWVIAGVVVLLGPGVLDLLRSLDEDESLSKDLPALIAALAALLGGIIARRNFLRDAAGAASDPGQSAARRRRTDVLAGVGGALLILALLTGIAYYVREALLELRPLKGAAADGFFATPVAAEATLALALVIWCAGFGRAVHVNRYSLHSMYRDRLSRTFLAATRWPRIIPAALFRMMGSVVATLAARQGWLTRASLRLLRVVRGEAEPPPEVWQFTARDPDKFTDFDRNDNPPMEWLDPRRRGGSGIYGHAEEATPAFVRAPLHVVNCALNMVGERDNAIQERKAASFTISPLHAGSARTGFRPVADYGGQGGITLATAMTISGAAVSPNAGQRSNPVSTFLMTLFNARLGWWLGHPKDAKRGRRTGPSQSLRPLVDELLGRTNSGGDWIYLSDGGHFENLGLYEMVRRGCRYIVVADASADPQRHFDDLGNAVRKIRLDLSVEIREVETFGIGGRELGEDGRYAALFEIEYPWDDQRYGQLLYVKTAMYKGNPLGAPMDAVEYGNRSPDFPHEPTSDQFFLETQFESYRALGEHQISKVMLQAEEDVPAIFAGAAEHIASPFE